MFMSVICLFLVSFCLVFAVYSFFAILMNTNHFTCSSTISEIDTCFNIQDTYKVFLKTSHFNRSMISIHYCIPAGDTMRAQGQPSRGLPCYPPSREKISNKSMEERNVPENDPAHQDQGLDLSAATWQPQAIPPAYQTWVSPQCIAARLLTSGDVEQNPGPPTNNKQKQPTNHP